MTHQNQHILVLLCHLPSNVIDLWPDVLSSIHVIKFLPKEASILPPPGINIQIEVLLQFGSGVITVKLNLRFLSRFSNIKTCFVNK